MAAMIAVTFLALASVARAAWDEKDVAKVVQAIKAGKSVVEAHDYPGMQVVHFSTAGLSFFSYTIDIKAQLCLASGGATAVSCKVLKKAYPLMAPFITWED